MNEALIYAITDETILMRLCQFSWVGTVVVGCGTFGGQEQLLLVGKVFAGYGEIWWVGSY